MSSTPTPFFQTLPGIPTGAYPHSRLGLYARVHHLSYQHGTIPPTGGEATSPLGRAMIFRGVAGQPVTWWASTKRRSAWST